MQIKSLPNDKHKHQIAWLNNNKTDACMIHSNNKLIVKMVTYLNALNEWIEANVLDCVQVC